MTRSISLLVALVVSALALASPGKTFFCQASGQVLESCCCSEELGSESRSLIESQPGSFKEPCCCHVLRALRGDASPIVLAKAVTKTQLSVDTLAGSGIPSPAEPAVAAVGAPRTLGPPSQPRIYLSLRHLLI